MTKLLLEQMEPYKSINRYHVYKMLTVLTDRDMSKAACSMLVSSIIKYTFSVDISVWRTMCFG